MNYQEINKNNLPKWKNTVRYLTSVLKKDGIKYYLSASGLEHILGSEKYPYDVDLFMSEESVRKLFDILKEYAISDLHKWEDRCLEFQGEYNSTPFEICEWEKKPKRVIQKEFKGFEISIIG